MSNRTAMLSYYLLQTEFSHFFFRSAALTSQMAAQISHTMSRLFTPLRNPQLLPESLRLLSRSAPDNKLELRLSKLLRSSNMLESSIKDSCIPSVRKIPDYSGSQKSEVCPRRPMPYARRRPMPDSTSSFRERL
jgi:hypothetical protein